MIRMHITHRVPNLCASVPLHKPVRPRVACGSATQAHQLFSNRIAIDATEYVSGKPTSTVLGRIISFVPPPIRFLASWVAPITVLISLHAHAVVQLAIQALNIAQGYSPILSAAVQAYSTPWLPLVSTALLSALPTLYAFIIVPALDMCVGEEQEPGFTPERSPEGHLPWYMGLFRVVPLGYAFLYCASMLSAAQAVAQAGVTLASFALVVVNLSVLGGFTFAVVHELVHSKHKFDRFVSHVVLTALCYPQWGVSHMAHHKQVATPEDPATARYRESVYPFVLRSVVGEVKDALRLEWRRARLQHPSLPAARLLLHSQIPGWFLWPVATACSMHCCYGATAALMYALSGAGSIFLLEVVNYIEHYGLSRRQLESGQYERVSVQHSWNANHLVSNAVLLRLQRHTDHHMHAARPFYALQNVEGAPKLPASYSVMILLALVPSAWFCVMNPRVHIHQMLVDIQQEAPEGT